MNCYKFINPEEWMESSESKKHLDIDLESYEEEKDPNYEAWKNVEQGRRLKRDVARLQREEKDNYPRILEKQNELIQLLEECLEKYEKFFEELREFYSIENGE